jgi:hypothetical protein
MPPTAYELTKVVRNGRPDYTRSGHSISIREANRDGYRLTSDFPALQEWKDLLAELLPAQGTGARKSIWF